MQKRVAFHTLGCKLNFSETSAISRLFTNEGFTKVEFGEEADVYVINTCSVTEAADKKCRQAVRQALKHSPKAFVAVTGCYAQLKPTEISHIEGVDLVLGANEKFNIISHLDNLSKRETPGVHACEIMHTKTFVPSYSAGDRTRSFLKVQDGCDYFCSFCTIPLARGRSRSNSIADTLKTVHEAVRTGIKEVVLTGVNIGDFGKNSLSFGEGGGETFFDLIKALDKVEGIVRFRISSIEPNLLSNEIIEFVAGSNKFVPHFHIPLQSGSDKILKLMRRRYESQLYANRIETIKTLLPDCCIGVDVIVGFPSETEEDFIETYNFINGLDVSYLHVFTYSERADTTALRIPGKVPQEEKNRRSKMLHILSEKKKRHFYEQQKGKTVTVLFEHENDDGFMYGFTENYIKVKTPYNPLLANELINVCLENTDDNGIYFLEREESIVNNQYSIFNLQSL